MYNKYYFPKDYKASRMLLTTSADLFRIMNEMSIVM